MRIFKIFSVCIIILILLLPINALQIDNPQYRVDHPYPNELYPQIIHPGDDVDVWFKITNNNNHEVKNIEVELYPKYPFVAKQVNPTKNTYKISHLNEGESDIVHFKLHVDENAKSGDYPIYVDVRGTEYYTEGDDVIKRDVSFAQTFYIPIYSIANFVVNCNGNNIINPSDTKSVDIYVINKGSGVAKNVNVQLIGSNNLNVVGPTAYYLGTVLPNSGKKISTKIYAPPNTDINIHSINALVTWIGEDGLSYNITIPINFRVVKQYTYYIVKANNTDIHPGETKSFMLQITNVGNEDSRNVIVKIDGSDGLNILGPTTYYLGNILKNKSKSMVININALSNIKTGIYPITLHIQWKNKDGSLKISDNKLNLRVVSDLNVRKPLIYLDSYTYKPDGSEIIVGIANLGRTYIRNSILSISGVKEVENSYIKYVGDMEGDDYSTESFKIYAKPGETVNLKVKYQYYDDNNKKYTIYKNFTLKFTKTSNSQNNLIYIVILVLIIIILGYIYHKRRSKKIKEEMTNI